MTDEDIAAIIGEKNRVVRENWLLRSEIKRLDGRLSGSLSPTYAGALKPMPYDREPTLGD